MKDEFGLIVKSLTGRDCNQFYVLIDSDERFVYLVDGKVRTLDKPKKKNRKHVQFTKTKVFNNTYPEDICKNVTNEFIKRKLKEFRNDR